MAQEKDISVVERFAEMLDLLPPETAQAIIDGYEACETDEDFEAFKSRIVIVNDEEEG